MINGIFYFPLREDDGYHFTQYVKEQRVHPENQEEGPSFIDVLYVYYIQAMPIAENPSHM